MTDRYRAFANSAPGRAIVSLVGLPDPAGLRPHQPGDPIVAAPVLLGGGDRLRDQVAEVLTGAGVELAGGLTGAPLAALVYDGTGLRHPSALRGLYDFFNPAGPALHRSGRVIVLGTPPPECRTAAEAAAQQALAGFVGAAGPALGRGVVAQLVYVSSGAEDMTESTLRFLLSARSACDSGQRIRIAHGVPPLTGVDWSRPLAGQVALVTAAAHGIGAAIAGVLARDGAHVICVDRPAAGETLAAVARAIGGTAVPVDLADDSAPRLVADELALHHHGVDIVVHNNGAVREPAPGRATAARWDQVLDEDLAIPERVTATLVGEKILRMGGRIVAVPAASGVAAGRGQTDVETTEAGVLGLVEAYARSLTKYSVTANAVLPRFTDSPIGAVVPGLTRRIARRLNDVTGGGLAQGSLPMHIAEAVGWLASPASGGVTGNVVRIGGQFVPGL